MFNYNFTYLAILGLNCSMLRSFQIYQYKLLATVYGSREIPNKGIEQGPLHWVLRVCSGPPWRHVFYFTDD